MGHSTQTSPNYISLCTQCITNTSTNLKSLEGGVTHQCNGNDHGSSEWSFSRARLWHLTEKGGRALWAAVISVAQGAHLLHGPIPQTTQKKKSLICRTKFLNVTSKCTSHRCITSLQPPRKVGQEWGGRTLGSTLNRINDNKTWLHREHSSQCSSTHHKQNHSAWAKQNLVIKWTTG